MSDVRSVRRALARVEDGRELLALVNQATARASAQIAAQSAEEDVAVGILAERVSDHLRNVGRVSALELLAKLGWWLIEEGISPEMQEREQEVDDGPGDQAE